MSCFVYWDYLYLICIFLSSLHFWRMVLLSIKFIHWQVLSFLWHFSCLFRFSFDTLHASFHCLWPPSSLVRSQLFNRVILPVGVMGVIFLLRFSWVSLSLTSRHSAMVDTGVGVSVLVLFGFSFLIWGVPGVSVVKNLPVNAGDSGLIPGSGIFPWRRKRATHCSILAGITPWTEEPGGLQSTGSQRVRPDWAHTHCQNTKLALVCL